MKQTLTNEEIKAFSAGIDEFAKTAKDVKLSHALARNQQKLRSLIRVLDRSTTLLPEFDKARTKLIRELAERDADGNPVQVLGGGYHILNGLAFQERVDVIAAETGQDKREEGAIALMQETEEIDVYMVAFETLPKETLPAAHEAVLWMIEDPIKAPVVELVTEAPV